MALATNAAPSKTERQIATDDRPMAAETDGRTEDEIRAAIAARVQAATAIIEDEVGDDKTA